MLISQFMILCFSGTSVRLLLIYGNKEKFQHLPVDVRHVLLQDERLVRIQAALWTQLMFSAVTFSSRCSGLLLRFSPGSDTTPGLWRRRRLMETSGPPAPSPGLGSVRSEGSKFRLNCWERLLQKATIYNTPPGGSLQHNPLKKISGRIWANQKTPGFTPPRCHQNKRAVSGMFCFF